MLIYKICCEKFFLSFVGIMHGIVYRGACPFMDSLKKKRLPITGGKISENFISVRDVPERGQKQGRDEKTQEHYPTFAKSTQ